jgi:hypothetical protein
MGTPNKVAQALRDAIIPMVSHLAPFQHAFVQRLSALDISYRGSPIIEGAGERYFDDSLRGGGGIRSRFLLVLGRDVDASTRESAHRLAGSLGDVVELRAGNGGDILLVRPTGMSRIPRRVITEFRHCGKCDSGAQTGSGRPRNMELLSMRFLCFVQLMLRAPAQPRRVVAIAHRGHLRHPENTMPAFARRSGLAPTISKWTFGPRPMAGWC